MTLVKHVIAVDGTAQDVVMAPEEEAATRVEWAANAAQVHLPELMPFQFRAMLSLSGKQAQVDAYIASLADPERTIAQAKLDYSLSFHRDDGLVLAAQQAIGLSDSELEALWTQAAAIT